MPRSSRHAWPCEAIESRPNPAAWSAVDALDPRKAFKTLLAFVAVWLFWLRWL
jgi:hypothetical protein